MSYPTDTGSDVRGDRIVVPHTSRALRQNPLGDPVERGIEVLLPPGYQTERRYPVVYWLPGFGAAPTLTNRPLALAPSPADRIHAAMAAGEVPEALLVVVDGTTAYGGSQYLDSAASGRYQEYLGEVVAEVDRLLPTLAEPGFRAVGGKSSGGYGALIAGMETRLFGSVLAHTPDAGFEHCYLPLLPEVLDTLRGIGGVTGLLEQGLTGPHDGRFMVALSLVAMGMCYAETRGVDPEDALPCDPRTGVFRPLVWDSWLRHDPVRLAPRYVPQLSGLDLLYLETGSRDEYRMHWGVRALHATLESLGVPHEYREHDGGHAGIEHRFLTSLGLLGRHWSTSAAVL